MASNNPIRLLIVEQQQNTVSVLRDLLDGVRTQSFDIRCSAGIDEALAGISAGRADVVVYDLAGGSNFYADEIQRLRGFTGAPPVVIIADADDEQKAIAAFHCGAQDYLIRGAFDGATFAHVIRSARERQQVALELDTKSREFHANEARLLNVVTSNADGIAVVDSAGLLLFINPAAKKMFGERSDDLAGKPFGYDVPPGTSREYHIELARHREAVVEMRAVPTMWGGMKACLISLRDITARAQAEDALRKSEERYALAMRGSKDGLWDWNLKTDEIFFSMRWKSIIGYGNNEISPRPGEWFRRVHKDDIERLHSDIASHLAGKTAHFENEHRLQHRDGTYRWVLVRGTAVRDSDGKAIRIAGSQSDFTERKEAEKSSRQALSDLKYALASEKVLLEELDRKNRELVELSITDGLTGLFNHRFIQERFDFEFKRAKRYDILLSCMLMDIDHFKTVNDTYGHQFGDCVLRGIADILKANSRDVDICGRYGGEEFMIISNQDEAGALRFASKLHSKIEQFPFKLGEQTVKVTVSIGVAAYTSDVLSKHELIERADTALYKAKEDGRNLIRVWKLQHETTESTLDHGGIENLKEKFRNLSGKMRATYMESTNALLRAVDAKDHYTFQHSQNVSRYAVAIARAMNMPEEDIEVLKYAGLLHDIGKIGVDESILVKKTSLSFEEFEILKKHSIIGVNILKDVQFLEKELPVILHHHERFDGNGYPQGLREREIPMGSRILGVADSFDAMTTDREFKAKLSLDDAIGELERGSGSQFAPEVVSVFVGILREKGIPQDNG